MYASCLTFPQVQGDAGGGAGTRSRGNADSKAFPNIMAQLSWPDDHAPIIMARPIMPRQVMGDPKLSSLKDKKKWSHYLIYQVRVARVRVRVQISEQQHGRNSHRHGPVVLQTGGAEQRREAAQHGTRHRGERVQPQCINDSRPMAVDRRLTVEQAARRW